MSASIAISAPGTKPFSSCQHICTCIYIPALKDKNAEKNSDRLIFFFFYIAVNRVEVGCSSFNTMSFTEVTGRFLWNALTRLMPGNYTVWYGVFTATAYAKSCMIYFQHHSQMLLNCSVVPIFV